MRHNFSSLNLVSLNFSSFFFFDIANCTYFFFLFPIRISMKLGTGLAKRPLSSQSTKNTPAAQARQTTRVATWSLYRKIETIGAGAFGIAYLVEGVPDRNGGRAGLFVIKRMFMQGTDDVLKAAATEVRVLQMVEPHPNIVAYHDHFIDDEGYINIVMEYCPGGDLEALIKMRAAAHKPFRLEEVLFIGFQLLCALRHLHSCGVVHRDLKPANIFICASDVTVSCPRDGQVITDDFEGDHEGNGTESVNNESSSSMSEGTASSHRRRVAAISAQTMRSVTGMTLKLADFGIAKVLETTQAVAKTIIGTPFYISPELCNDQPYGNGADIWALGCILYEVASGTGAKCFPGDNMVAVVRKICSGEVPHLPPSIDLLLRPMLMSMLQPLESQRLSATQVLRDFFYTADTDFADDFEDPEEDGDDAVA